MSKKSKSAESLLESCQLYIIANYKAVVKQKQSSRGVLKNLAKFTGKPLCQSIFLNKVAGACNFIKKEAPVNF